MISTRQLWNLALRFLVGRENEFKDIPTSSLVEFGKRVLDYDREHGTPGICINQQVLTERCPLLTSGSGETRDNEELRTEIKRLTDSLNVLRRKLADSEETRQMLRTKVQLLSEQLKGMETELGHGNGEIKNLTEQLGLLNSDNAMLRTTVMSLGVELTQARESQQRLVTLNHTQKQRLEPLEAFVHQMKGILK